MSGKKKTNVGSIGHVEGRKPNLKLKQSVKTMRDPKGSMNDGLEEDNSVLVDIESDEDFLKDSGLDWNDIHQLSNQLALSIQEFIGSVNSIAGNPIIINNLGDKKPKFEKLVTMFFKDLEEYSYKIGALRRECEDKSGPILDFDAYDDYNRIAIEYHQHFEELDSLISPTLSAIMVIVTDTTEGVELEDVIGEVEEDNGSEEEKKDE